MTTPWGLDQLLLLMWRQGASGQPTEPWLALRRAWIEPLREAGVFDDQQAQRWIARFQTAARDDGRPIEGNGAAASALLEHYLDAVPDGSGATDEAVLRFGAALYAIDALGLADGPDPRDWLPRVARRYGPPPPVTPQQQAELEAHQRRAAVASQASLAELQRIVPGRPERQDGMCVTSVEIYDGGGTLCWNGIFDGDPPRGWPEAMFSLADDLGTDYVLIGGGYSALRPGKAGERRTYGGEAAFAPAPPAAASVLTVAFRDSRIAVSLASG